MYPSFMNSKNQEKLPSASVLLRHYYFSPQVAKYNVTWYCNGQDKSWPISTSRFNGNFCIIRYFTFISNCMWFLSKTVMHLWMIILDFIIKISLIKKHSFYVNLIYKKWKKKYQSNQYLFKNMVGFLTLFSNLNIKDPTALDFPFLYELWRRNSCFISYSPIPGIQTSI